MPAFTINGVRWRNAMPADTDQARLIEAWEAGKLVIIATVAEGSIAGHVICCITPRRDVRDLLRRAERDLRNGPDVLHSVTSAIRRAVLTPTAHLAPGKDANLMGDLAILMTYKLAAQSDDVLEGSGLFSLHLQVDPDASKPWSQRGFLNAHAARTAVPTEIGA